MLSKLKSFFRHPIKAIQNRQNDRYEARMKRRLKPEVYNTLPDKKAIEAKYFRAFYKKLNLRHPKTFNEKLQWLKLYDRRPEYIPMVDKYEVKKLIAEKVGAEYAVQTLGVWDRAEEIDFDALPEQFVLKCTHDSASVTICTDKKTLDKEIVKKNLNSCLEKSQFLFGREWPYLGVKPRIIAEPYLTDESGTELKDYKVFCFGGRADYIDVHFGRFIGHKKNHYDFDWKPLDFVASVPTDYSVSIPKPQNLKKMKEIAERLSQGIPFLRVDFYCIYDKLYVGELTFFPGSGFLPFTPPEWDEIFGSCIKLPKKKQTGKISFLRRIWHHFIDPLKDRQYTRMVDLLTPGNYEKLPDKKLLKLKYLQLFEKKLDLRHPKTFNEKLQWLKLYDRKPEYIPMVDKYEAKKFIAERIGEEYVVPTLGVWDRAEDIDFDALPEQFVLKCTHDSGSIVICKDKKGFDKEGAKEKLAACLQESAFDYGREWPYLGVKPRIIAEPYLVDESGWELKDYKIFCFNGKANYLDIHFDRFTEHKQNHYDFDWNPLPFTFASVPNDYSIDFPMPKNLEQMKKIAETLSRDIPFLRVDLYNVYNRLYVGELTFYPGSGFSRFDPPKWDETFGSWLTLPRRKTKAKSIQKYQ